MGRILAEYSTSFTATENPLSESSNWLADPPGSWSGFGNVQSDGSDAKASAAFTEAFARYIGASIGAAQFAEITVTDTNSGECYRGATVRMVSTSDFSCYLFEATKAVGWDLWRLTDNNTSLTFTRLGSRDTGHTPAAGDLGRIWIDASHNISTTVNGAASISGQNDGTFATGNPGFHVGDEGGASIAKISDWRGGDGDGTGGGGAATPSGRRSLLGVGV